MDVRLSPEQRTLRDSAAKVVADLAAKAVGELDDAERAAKLDAAVSAAGWRELRGSDDDGSPWASGVEVGVVAEELGRGLADTSFAGPTLAAELRRLAGAPAATEPEAVVMTADLSELATLVDGAVPAGSLAVDVAGSSTALALSADGGKSTLVGVPIGEPQTRVDLTRPVASVAGDAVVAVPDQTRAIAGDDLDRVTALGLAITCADLVGTMHGAVDLTTGYVSERRQYGQPVGAFQAVQHLLADALVVTEGSRSLALHAAWAVDALPASEARLAGATAKAYASRAARQVCETAIQAHGGIGNTWECLAHVFLRRALLSTDLFGGVDANLSLVLADRVAPTAPGEGTV